MNTLLEKATSLEERLARAAQQDRPPLYKWKPWAKLYPYERRDWLDWAKRVLATVESSPEREGGE